jgi:uncharacterized protein YcfJ
LQKLLRFGWAWTGLLLTAHAAAQVTLFEQEEFRGKSFTAAFEVESLQRQGFNDQAASVVVKGDRLDRWELCQGSRFRGPCVVLQPGHYTSLAAMGMNDGVSSVRPIGRRDAPSHVTMAGGQIDVYANEGFRGRSFSAVLPVSDLRRGGFDDRASSLVVTGGPWEICPEDNFGGPCTVLEPGQYPSLRALGLNNRISSVRAISRREQDDGSRPTPPPVAPSQVSRIVFYENEGFQGRSIAADGAVEDFRRFGFNDRASSVVISGGRWEACQDIRYGGACVVLRPGQYPSLASMGMNDRVSSVRAIDESASVDDRRYGPLPLVSRDYGRRDEERLYQADITSVRAVVEDSGERCWVEPHQVVSDASGGANVPGALLGAVIGGILGHQVGGGTGKNVATGIGVVAGAAIGGNSGRAKAAQQIVTTQNVQRCSRNPDGARAAYWDVTYSFRGQEHRLQLNRAPGRTVTVNEQGEPRN